jgi:SAM-dependent methyltransferase
MKGHHVICSDLTSPADKASLLHSKHKYTGTIEYEAIDATNIPYTSRFDVVVIKSILGGISMNGQSHLQDQVVHEVYKCLKPGGVLLFAENLVASRLHRFFRKRFTQWGNYWNYLEIKQLPVLFKEFAQLKWAAAGFLGAFGFNESNRSFFGKLDTLLVEKIVPARMKYIVYGVATKS